MIASLPPLNYSSCTGSEKLNRELFLDNHVPKEDIRFASLSTCSGSHPEEVELIKFLNSIIDSRLPELNSIADVPISYLCQILDKQLKHLDELSGSNACLTCHRQNIKGTTIICTCVRPSKSPNSCSFETKTDEATFKELFHKLSILEEYYGLQLRLVLPSLLRRDFDLAVFMSEREAEVVPAVVKFLKRTDDRISRLSKLASRTGMYRCRSRCFPSNADQRYSQMNLHFSSKIFEMKLKEPSHMDNAESNETSVYSKISKSARRVYSSLSPSRLCASDAHDPADASEELKRTSTNDHSIDRPVELTFEDSRPPLHCRCPSTPIQISACGTSLSESREQANKNIDHEVSKTGIDFDRSPQNSVTSISTETSALSKKNIDLASLKKGNSISLSFLKPAAPAASDKSLENFKSKSFQLSSTQNKLSHMFNRSTLQRSSNYIQVQRVDAQDNEQTFQQQSKLLPALAVNSKNQPVNDEALENDVSNHMMRGDISTCSRTESFTEPQQKSLFPTSQSYRSPVKTYVAKLLHSQSSFADGTSIYTPDAAFEEKLSRGFRAFRNAKTHSSMSATGSDLAKHENAARNSCVHTSSVKPESPEVSDYANEQKVQRSTYECRFQERAHSSILAPHFCGGSGNNAREQAVECRKESSGLLHTLEQLPDLMSKLFTISPKRQGKETILKNPNRFSHAAKNAENSSTVALLRKKLKSLILLSVETYCDFKTVGICMSVCAEWKEKLSPFSIHYIQNEAICSGLKPSNRHENYMNFIYTANSFSLSQMTSLSSFLGFIEEGKKSKDSSLIVRDLPRAFGKSTLRQGQSRTNEFTSSTVDVVEEELERWNGIPTDVKRKILGNVLFALAGCDDTFTYCQGQERIICCLMMIYGPHLSKGVDPIDISGRLFRIFSGLYSKFSLKQLYDVESGGMLVCVETFMKLVELTLPQLCQHFATIELYLDMILFGWFQTLFCSTSIPHHILLRLFDWWISSGDFGVFYCFGLALLKTYEPKLLSSDFDDAMLVLNTLPNESMDCAALIKCAKDFCFFPGELMCMEDSVRQTVNQLVQDPDEMIFNRGLFTFVGTRTLYPA